MIEIEIDGKLLQVAEGSTVIEAADAAGIYIPRFCYHKQLSIAANCRMCLVEIEKVGKPLPACATTVTSGMKVFTRSKKALEAQRAVMEFLLINHPLDCPICDQGGECELQDLSMGFGRSDSDYCEPKRAVASEDIGPLIETWMTRCIHCTRCVRFGDEIAGLREMGATGRGEHMEIGTYVKHFLHSEISGNIIDICPVGALTNKPARYTGRSWEYREHPSIAPHDAVGSHIFVHSRAASAITPERVIMRAVPREQLEINENWVSDRDRFSVHGLYQDRVAKPRVNRNGEWIEIDWQRAFDEIVDRSRAIIQHFGADQLAGLASPQATLEEMYLMQKCLRALGSPHLDHRLRTQDFSDQAAMPLHVGSSTRIQDVEQLQTIILIGSHIRLEQPLLAHRIRKAQAAGAKVLALNARIDKRFPITHTQLISPSDWVSVLTDVLKQLEAADQADQAATPMTESDSSSMSFLNHLKQAAQENSSQTNRVAFFLGEAAMNHPEAAEIRRLIYRLAEKMGAAVNLMTEGPNSAGAWLAGMVPHRGAFGSSVTQGSQAKQLLVDEPVRAYFLLHTELEYDAQYSAAAIGALKQAGLVVCLTPFVTEAMLDYADFILPITPYTETAGTYVNTEGRWQSFSAAVDPWAESKPAWKVWRVLANFFELPGFDYRSCEEIQREMHNQYQAQTQAQDQGAYRYSSTYSSTPKKTNSLYRLGSWPMYRVDALVRRSKPLQQAAHQDSSAVIQVSPATAARLGFAAGDRVQAIQGDSRLCLPLMINADLADELVYLPAGLDCTQAFGQADAEIVLVRGDAA